MTLEFPCDACRERPAPIDRLGQRLCGKCRGKET